MNMVHRRRDVIEGCNKGMYSRGKNDRVRDGRGRDVRRMYGTVEREM